MVDAGLFIGTSGWANADWRATFDAGVPRKRWLEHFTACFEAVEMSATYYGALPATVLERWRKRTLDTFHSAIKGSRYITHTLRLADAKANATGRTRMEGGRHA